MEKHAVDRTILLASAILASVILLAKRNPDSIHHQALGQWLGRAAVSLLPVERMPTWVQWVVLAVATVAVLVIAFSLLLRVRVRARTRELQEAEARYRGLFERVPIGLYSTTPEGEIVEANPALAQMLGYPDRKSLLGMNARNLYVDVRDRERELAQVDSEGEVRGYELRLRRADGTPIWVRDYSRAIRDERGRVIRYEGALEDINQCKAAEKELERSEALFRVLAEEALVGVYLIQDGRFRYVNPTLAAMFGYVPEEIIDRLGPLDLTAPEDRSRVAENIRRRIEGEVRRLRYTFRGLRKDGTTFDCEVMGTQVDYEGRPAILGTAQDITEQKRAEERRTARARRQAALVRLGLVALSERDLDAFLDEVVSVVAATLGADLCKVLQLLPDGERFLLRAGVGWKEKRVGRTIVPVNGDSQAGYTLSSREAVVVEDMRTETRFHVPSLLREHGAVSGISVIIGTPEKPWGVLGLHTTRPRRFDREEVDFVQTVANIVAQFIARSEAEEAVRKQARRLEALREIGLELAAKLDLDTLLQSIVERAVELIGGKFGALDLYQPEEDALKWTVGVGSLPMALGLTLHRGEGLSGKVWETGRPLVVEDYSRWEGRAVNLDGFPYRAMVGAPIQWGEEFLGVIIVGSDEPGVFTTADAELLGLFALQVAIAIRNAQLYAEKEKRLREQETLHRAAVLLSSSLDPQTVLERMAEEMARAVDATSAYICKQEPGTTAFTVVAEYIGPEACEKERVSDLGVTYWEDDEEFLENMRAGRFDYSFIDDPDLDERERRHMEQYGAKSIVYIPLHIEGQLVGFAEVWESRYKRKFTPDEIALCQAIAQQAAVAIRNAQYVAALAEERERLALLHRLGERMATSLDIHEVARQALDDVCTVVGAQWGVIAVWNPDARRLRPVAASGYDAEMIASLAPRLQLPLDERSLVGWVGVHRTPAVVADVTTDERWLQVAGFDDRVRSALVVPLISRGELVGTMSMYSDQAGFFSQEHLQLVESAAATVAAAIANARLYEREREQRRFAEALAEAAAVVGSTLELEEVLDRILEQVSRVIPNDATNFMLIEGEDVRIVRWKGYEKFGPASVDFVSDVVFRLSEVANLRQMKETQEPIVVPDTATYPEWVQVPEQAWLRSYAAAPIVVRGEVIGFLNVDSATPGFFTEAHLGLLKVFANYAASAIANARLYEETRRRALEQETLRKAMLALSTVRNPDEAIERILAELERVVPYDSASVQVLEGNTLRIVGGRGFPNLDELLGITFDITRDDSPNRLVVERRTFLIEEDVAEKYAEFRREPHAKAGIRSWLGVPMVVGDRLIGIIALDKREPGFYTEEHARLAEAFAAQAAVALENAQLHARLRAHAEQLERRVEERTAELRQERERVQAILDAAGEGIFVTDVRGCIEYMNPAAEEMTGYRLEELRGQHLWVCAADEEQVERMRPMKDTLRAGKQWREEVRLRRKDGTEFDAAIVVAPILGEKGLVGSVSVVEDVTPFRELDRMKSRIISNISHEFRTPLATAKLYIELARRQPSLQEEHLKAADAELDHLTNLVEDMLEVTRIDASRVILRLQTISLDELVAPTVKRYRPLAEERGLRLEYRPGKPDRTVEVDPERMRQVLDNLLSNAIRYTPSGGLVVVSTGTAEAKGQTWATITVADTGIGIPKNELPHIFERFFRGEQPRRMQVPGTGLGLSIVKDFVEMHGGFVTVESQVGEGSTFTVWLPLAAQE